MPLAVSFTAACARGLGLGNGEAPRVPTSVSVTASVITITATYTITVSTFPLSRVEYRIARGGDAGQYTGSLPGANGSNSSGTISTRVTAAGATENLVHATDYTIFFRAIDASGQISPETAGDAFTTAAEVAPTAAAPTLASLSVTSPTAPYIDITWAAGTAGTYSIATRQYSVVAGTGAAGTFTTVTGSTGTVRVTTTAAGAAILPGTAYRVYMKYIASTTSTERTASTDITTGTEVTANAITAQASSTGLTFDQHRTQFVISRGNVPNATTYTQNYQFAYGTSINPTNWAYFPNYGFDSSVTITGLTSDATYYARTRAISTVTSAAGTASGNASVRLNAALPPTPTIAFRSMSSSSYGTAQFTISGNGGSTDSVYIYRRPTSGTNTGATPVLKATGSQDISGYTSDGGTEYYVAYNFNRHSEASAPSNQIRWTRPAKNQGWNSGYIRPDPIYFSTTAACTSEFAYTFGAVPSSDEEVGYIAVTGLSVDGIQQTGSGLNGCSATQTLANTGSGNLFWLSNSSHPQFTEGFGLSSTTGFSPNWGTGTFSTRSITLSAWGGSNISGKYFLVGTGVGSRTGACAVGCSVTSGTLNAYRMKNFIITGVQTTAGSVGT